MTLTAGQTSTFPLGDNTTCDITPTDQGDGTLLYKMNFQRTDPTTGVTVLGTPRVIAAREARRAGLLSGLFLCRNAVKMGA